MNIVMESANCSASTDSLQYKSLYKSILMCSVRKKNCYFISFKLAVRNTVNSFPKNIGSCLDHKCKICCRFAFFYKVQDPGAQSVGLKQEGCRMLGANH